MAGYVVSPPRPATHNTPKFCSPGTATLAVVIKERFPALLVLEGAYGCYNRRPISGGTAKSVHGDGRALDIGVGQAPTVEQLQQMAELTWITTNSCYVLGVQRMLWNRHSWTADRGWRPSESMGGPHLDHMHLEQTPIAAWSRPLPRAVARCAYGLP